MINLGYVNSWKAVPELYKICKSLGHKLEKKTKGIGRSEKEYFCLKCNYCFKEDSSG
jgi:hypothetical protein